MAAEGIYFGNIDAQFGTEMEKSTKAFQMKYGLDPDGEVGKETWTVLFGIMGNKTD